MYKVYKNGVFVGWAIGKHYTAQKTNTGYSVTDPAGYCTKETKTLKDARLWVIKEGKNHD